jgi:hypothetical protein
VVITGTDLSDFSRLLFWPAPQHDSSGLPTCSAIFSPMIANNKQIARITISNAGQVMLESS